MPYSRARGVTALPEGDALSCALAGIGIGIAAEPTLDPDLEPTLLAASVAGMVHDDLRVLALLVTWFDVHAPRVNADRLTRLVASQTPRVRAFWAAVAKWKQKDRRLARLARAYRGPVIDLLATGSDFQLRRRGEDPRFAGTKLRVPAGVLRDRPVDVMAPAALARHHRAYRWRLIVGPTFRADLWAALERDPAATAYALARATGSSYATAWATRGDFLLLGNVEWLAASGTIDLSASAAARVAAIAARPSGPSAALKRALKKRR